MGGRFYVVMLLVFCVACGKQGAQASENNFCAVETDELIQSQNKIHTDVLSGQYEQIIIGRKQTLQPSGRALETYSVRYSELSIVNSNENFEVVRFSPAAGRASRDAVLERLAQDESVEYVEPDYPIFAEEMSELAVDPFADKQWAHKKVQSQAAWQISSGNHKIVVGVIDSGVDVDHPDLADNIFVNTKEALNGKDDDGNGFIDDRYGWDFAYNDNNASPDTASGSSHGTHVAGIIGAVLDNGIGIVGHAPQVQIIPLRFMKDSNGGSSSDAIRAIDYAIKMKVDVLNMSFGSKSYSQAFYDALTRAQKAGVLVVVASGNSKLDLAKHDWFPTKYPHTNMITVAATNSQDLMWDSGSSGSNYNSKYVDVAAPGVSIYSTVNAGKYSNKTGTSMASPMVAGLAVLLLGEDPSLTTGQVIAAIKQSVDPLTGLKGRVAAGGRVNSYKAVKLAGQKSALAELQTCIE